MLILGIETACDDSAAAVVEDGRYVRSSLVASQNSVHEKHGGIVPELAARQHVEVISRVVQGALKEARVSLDQITAIAVNSKHGLLRSVMVGVAAAKGIAMGANKPLVAVHHIEGHIYSAKLSDSSVQFPHLCLAVAGGHNLLILVEAIGRYRIIGRSLDDAAGEAFDKVAIELGLGMPGGPAVSKLATRGDQNAFAFPRPMLKKSTYDFSFSGLKTAVRTEIRKLKELDDLTKANIAASFEAAAVEVLVTKLISAAQDLDVRQVTVVGGVAANSRLRSVLGRASSDLGLSAIFTNRELCTDNAAMIAGLGYHAAKKQEYSELDFEAVPNAPLGEYLQFYK